MEKQKTKEELIAEIAKLETQLKDRVEYGERVRREFAKAFNWGERKGGLYDYDKKFEWTTPSWEQIFVEVGKLLACRNFYDLEGNVSELECKLEDLEKRLIKDVNPNL